MHSSPIRRRARTLLLLSLLAAPACGGADESTSNHPVGKLDGAVSDVSADVDAAPNGDAAIDHDGSAQADVAADGCAPGLIDCGGGCIDPSTNAAHCGTCGHACGANEQCDAGVCEGVGCGTDCAPFSIVLLPDTQYYTSKQANNAQNTYRKQAQWILDHRQSDNIRFAMHLGDITGSNEAAQWDVPDTAHGLLDKASMPYAVVPGNHDYMTNPGWDRGASHFDEHFGPNRFAGKPWYGGGYGSSNTNNYTFFEVGFLKFMVLSLEYSPRKEVLCWAEDLIAKHPNHRVILATHCYLTHGGGYSTGCPDESYATLGANGSNVFRELASRHSNVFLVASGHIDASNYHLAKGNTGNDVHEIVVDYQFEGPCTKSSASACTDNCRAGSFTGNGWFRKMTFDPLNNTVHSETLTVEDGNTNLFPGGKPVLFCSELYKPTDPAADGGNWYSQDPKSSDHQFDFPYDMTTAVPYVREDLGKRAFIDRTINSAGTGDQLAPKVVMAPSGSFVAVWEDDSSAADGAGNHDIMARGLSAGGCSGFKDLVVNTNTAGQQQSPSVAMDAQGNFVVVWADDADDNGTFQIHGRGFAADGSERIPLFTVNSTAKGQQRHPAIAMAPDGRFVVAWENDEASDGHEQIWVRGFAANGGQSFADRSVHSDALGKRIEPAIGLDGNGAFVVVWQDDTDANGTYQIHGRGFDAAGNERFAKLAINSQAAGQQRKPAIGVDGSGAFVVAWEDDQDGDGNYQVWARGFNASGTATLPDFRVHTSTGGQHLVPAVARESAGGFVISWQDDGDGNGSYQIRARSMKADGSSWKDEWQVNTVAAGQQRAPHVAVNSNGTVVGIWEDDMDGNGSYQIVARGFDL